MISKLAVFDIRNATAFNPDDIEKIFALIRAMPGNGFVTINSQIKGQCAWLAGWCIPLAPASIFLANSL